MGLKFERISRYQITRELGKGAMGEVFLAYDPDLDREVAIKTIYYDPGIPEAELKEAKLRFTREARVAAKLNHANIVIIHDVGEHENIPFIAMECIHGETLEPYVKSVGLLPLKRVVEIVGQAAEALDYAHRSDLVHRDIKPSNIMLTQEGSVKVMDFGLAKKPTANLTQAGMLLGTPSYMSPEQIKGEALDGRSDLFSLGVVLYQMLTGEKPFPGEGITTIIHKILSEEPKAPTILNAKLPRQFDDIVRKALAKDAAQRFQTGREMKTALENHMDFTARMSRIRPGAPRATDATEDTAALSAVNIPIATGPQPAKAPPRDMRKIWKGLAAAAVLAAAIFAGASPAKSWMKEKSLDPEFPLPVFLITWANDGVNPRLLSKKIYVEVERGADITLNGVRLETPVFELPATDPDMHVLVAVSGCKRGEKRFHVSQVDKQINLELEPALVETVVTSSPAGATVRYGKDFSLETPTPATLRLNACESHDIRVALDGYYEVKDAITVLVDKPGAVREPYVLKPLPKPGRIRFAKAAYAYEVRQEGRLLGRGGDEKELPPGRYNVALSNADYHFERLDEFTVESEKTLSYSPRLPGLGMLNVICYTDATAFINEVKTPPLPFFERKIAAGKYKIKCITRDGNALTADVEIVADKITDVRFAQDKASGPEAATAPSPFFLFPAETPRNGEPYQEAVAVGLGLPERIQIAIETARRGEMAVIVENEVVADLKIEDPRRLELPTDTSPEMRDGRRLELVTEEISRERRRLAQQRGVAVIRMGRIAEAVSPGVGNTPVLILENVAIVGVIETFYLPNAGANTDVGVAEGITHAREVVGADLREAALPVKLGENVVRRDDVIRVRATRLHGEPAVRDGEGRVPESEKQRKRLRAREDVVACEVIRLVADGAYLDAMAALNIHGDAVAALAGSAEAVENLRSVGERVIRKGASRKHHAARLQAEFPLVPRVASALFLAKGRLLELSDFGQVAGFVLREQ
jgi:tRNA A-37 threonylcarbamoyl transferase component Bud32